MVTRKVEYKERSRSTPKNKGKGKQIPLEEIKELIAKGGRLKKRERGKRDALTFLARSELLTFR